MSNKLGPNSSIYKYGSRRNLQYLFTKDNMFGLKVTNTDYDSIYLYINIEIFDDVINSDSPLAKFIKDGFIKRIPDDEIDGEDEDKDIDEDEDDLDNPIMIQYETMPGEYEDIDGGFYKYIFHRKLIDYRHDEITNERTEELEGEKNENDCLNFAECSAAKNMGLDEKGIKTFPYEHETSILQAKYNNKTFGLSDEENMELLKTIPKTHKNDNAVPEPGEAYAIVRRELIDAVMYHIGFCLYSYKGVNITLEANADQGREFMPEFGFYDRNPNGFTFYKRYIKMYPNSDTIVLSKRDEEVILREIGEEMGELKENPIIEEREEEKNDEITDEDISDAVSKLSLRTTEEAKGGKKIKKRRLTLKLIKNNRKTKTHKWSSKYKKSINCRRPKGFSQKQYCKYGRKTKKLRK